VNKETPAHWGAVAPKTKKERKKERNKQTNERKLNSSEKSLMHTEVPNATETLIRNYGKKIGGRT
jgi:hypothetical protein